MTPAEMTTLAQAIAPHIGPDWTYQPNEAFYYARAELKGGPLEIVLTEDNHRLKIHAQARTNLR